MNRIYLPLVVGTLLTFLSCGKVADEYTIENQNITLRTSADPILYADLQWTSYIIAGLLLEDEDDFFRTDFSNISTSTGTVLLSDLFDDPQFNSRFTELAYDYFEEEVPTNPGIKANAPKNKPARPPRGVIDETSEAAMFLDAVKSYDCAEIYFPKKLFIDNGINTITSTGHPLNTDLVSEGYKWESSSNKSNVYFNVSYVDVDNIYVDENRNVIVARLVNTTINNNEEHLGDCVFVANHPEIDFTDFLNQD